MILRKDLLQSIECFLELVPVQTRQRGRGYHASGNVLELECVEPDHLYAAVVRGGEDYEVGLEFADKQWASDCSCPMQYDCKHVVAAMLELRRRALADAGGSSSATVIQAPKNKPPRDIPGPPRSPLYNRLVENLGRELRSGEAAFVERMQTFYTTTSVRPPVESDLGLITGGGNAYSYWQELKLWPERPRDVFYCWLYIARELRRRHARYPEFMDGITDLSLIEAEMAAWEREKEVAHWKDWFRNFAQPEPASDAGALELRLVLHPDEARLQWRTEPGAAFAEFKQSHAKRFSGQFERGALKLGPESLPLWSAIFKPWQHESWWSFKYLNATARPALNRLLRLPLAPDRVVTPDNQPLARGTEPLRLQLRPPQNGDANYEIVLATADGSPPPKIHCTLAGHASSYSTSRSLVVDGIA